MRISEAINRVVTDVQDNAVLVALAAALFVATLCLATFGLITAAVWARDWWRARRTAAPAGRPAPNPATVGPAAVGPTSAAPPPVDAPDAPAPTPPPWPAPRPGRFPQRRIEAYTRLAQKSGDWPAWQFELDQFAVTMFEPDDDGAPD